MSISYSLAPNPKWYIADLVGLPLAGGFMATFSNLNHTILNPVFQDPAGMFPWPYVTIPNVGSLGILFDENGSQGPFYFAFDSSNPNQLYFLEIYDSNGVLQWTIDNFTPGSGGGSVITTAIDLENLVINNVLWRNLGTSPIATTQVMELCPGAHSALALTSSNAGPDIYFLKNNLSASDTISFPNFILGSTPLIGDVTPVNYMNYTCTLAGSAETQKCVQYPITQGVQNLSNQAMTTTIWARSNAGAANVTLQWRQFFGDGTGASTDVITPIQTVTLNSTWQKFVIPNTIPSVSGMVIGGCHNDGLFLQVQFPLNATCNIDHIKTSAYVGNLSPTTDYHSYDMIDAIISDFRTGDVKTSIGKIPNLGWVALNDGTIGNPSSNATSLATFDTFPLFNFLWNNVGSTNAPMFNSSGTPISYGASAVADYTANNQISLTKQLGRDIACVGTPSVGGTNWALGQFSGTETHLIVQNQLPPILNVNISSTSFNYQVGGATQQGIGGLGVTTVAILNSSGGQPLSIIQPTTHYNMYMKL